MSAPADHDSEHFVLRRRDESRLRPLLYLAPFLAAALALQLIPAGRGSALAVDGSASAGPIAGMSAGETFPGSAYFFAEDAFASAAPGGRATDAQLAPEFRGNPHILAVDVGPAATPLVFSGKAPLDRARALACMTNAIYYEAGNEPIEGQRAVAQVVLNRLRHPEWPDSVCGVIYQGGERADLLCQFSFSCDGSMARVPDPRKWAQARRVAERALAGEVFAPAGLSTYYHTLAVRPGWASRLTATAIIGAHIFYRMPGPTGALAAFSDRYPGRETVAGPGPYAFVAPSKLPPLDPALLGPGMALPASLARSDDAAGPGTVSVFRPAAQVQAPAAGSAAPPTALTPAGWTGAAPSPPAFATPSSRLPQSTVKPEFANSGRPL